MLREGEYVGNYRVISQLGQGGMATVFKAHHASLNRYVALKMIHQSFLNDNQFVARFKREAQIIAQLEHPNIVPVYDFDEYEGQPFLIMKYIPGIALSDSLVDGPLELRDTMAVLPKVAAGLDYAHQQGILHRDIKPSNIMLDESARTYVTDFGLARTVDAGESTLSRGMLVGTPAYMSPEQGEGVRELDARSDLYSLGVVMYELIVGRVPFTGGSTYTILRDHMTTPPPSPSSLNPDVPAAVEAVLFRALAKDPDDRFQTASDMVVALRDAFVESKVRRLNAGERHTLMMSLQNLRDDFMSDVADGEQTPPVVVFDHTPDQSVTNGSRTSMPASRSQKRALAALAQPDQALVPAQPTALKVPSTAHHPANRRSLPLVLGALALVVLVAVAAMMVVLVMHELQEEPEYRVPTVIVTRVEATSVPVENQAADTQPSATITNTPIPTDLPTRQATATIAPTFTYIPTDVRPTLLPRPPLGAPPPGGPPPGPRR